FFYISRVGLPSSKELFDAKLEKKTLQKGLLLEFRKDSQKKLLAVVQKPDGKKNWMVCDQVPINNDPSILECAWMELSENKRTVTAEELAEIIYGSKESLESYCSHLLLSRDDIYFNVVDNKGYCSLYEPRPSVQVSYCPLLFHTLCHFNADGFYLYCRFAVSKRVSPVCIGSLFLNYIVSRE
ncbi:hypothetical protein GW17_00043352, partial [Ensete ventricosum]